MCGDRHRVSVEAPRESDRQRVFVETDRVSLWRDREPLWSLCREIQTDSLSVETYRISCGDKQSLFGDRQRVL